MSYSYGGGGVASAQRTLVVSSRSGFAAEKRENMSTQVTVHRMVTTTTTSALLINVGYVKTFPGILKIFQILLGCVAVGIIGHYITDFSYNNRDYLIPELFFLLISSACLITTSILLFSCLCSITTSSIIPKTLFETMYHIVASCLYFACSLYLLIYLTEHKRGVREYVPKVAASALGLVNTALYILSSIYSVRTFRRG